MTTHLDASPHSTQIDPDAQSHPLGPDLVEASDAKRSYGRVAVGLHWLLVLAVFYQLALGLWMIDLPKVPVGLRAAWFNWHKSIGLVIGLLMCLRLTWRVTHALQDDGLKMPRWQHLLSKSNHFCLYVTLLLMPLSGFLGSNFTPYPVKFFGWVLPRFLEPSSELKSLCSVVHAYTSYTLIALIVLHLLGALWHGVKRDGVLSRMAIKT